SNWHDIAYVYQDSSSRRLAKIYIDGVLINNTDITGIGDWSTFKSTYPLTIGYKQGDYTSYMSITLADLKVFNVALTPTEIYGNLCTQNPLVNHTKKDNLIGYWPCNDGIGGVFKNYAPSGAGKDFVIENIGSWSVLNDIPCAFPSSPGTGKLSLVLTSLDIAPLTAYWLGLNVNSVWSWQGSASWIGQYEVEFLE